jgi:ribosomal protein L23
LSTYITTLVARFFRIFIAIAAYFNLKIKQFNIINAFENAKRLVKGSLIVY